MASLPGGDPLEVAVAAGETPSPDLVAAAGKVGDLAPGWAWAGLVFVMHRGRVLHPAVIQPGPAPGRLRRGLGWILDVIFCLSFVVVPIQL